MGKIVLISLLLVLGCASKWKLQGGPDSCKKMCTKWGLEFSAMVGVGDQESASGEGATACVCQPKGLVKSAAVDGGSASSTSMAGPIVAAAQAAAAAAMQQQQMMSRPAK